MKIKSLSINGFRGLRRFEMNGLGRVNLIVGTNNCGKTSVLEAVNILMSRGDVSALWSTLFRRGEELLGDREPTGSISRQADIRRLFFGHEINIGNRFPIFAETDLFSNISTDANIDNPRVGQQFLFEFENDQFIAESSESSEDYFPVRL